MSSSTEGAGLTTAMGGFGAGLTIGIFMRTQYSILVSLSVWWKLHDDPLRQFSPKLQGLGLISSELCAKRQRSPWGHLLLVPTDTHIRVRTKSNGFGSEFDSGLSVDTESLGVGVDSSVRIKETRGGR